MEYKEDYNNICKQRMKSILKYFISFCDNHNLRYYCSQGTCLGVVRHHGFIPWDDDIDVMMPRPDYNKLIGELSGEISNDLELVTPYNTPNYYLPFAKLIEKKSTIIERRKIPCTLGLFIDIFPINGMPDNRDETLNISKSYSLYRQKLTEVSSREGIIDLLYFCFSGQFGRVGRSLKYYFSRDASREKILSRLHELGEKYNYDDSIYVSVEDSNVIEQPFPKDWLEPSVIMAFDELKVSMPRDSDSYLKHAYGNYMEFPPEEQRINNHMESLFYFNLYERIDYSLVKKEIMKEYIKKRRKKLFGILCNK